MTIETDKTVRYTLHLDQEEYNTLVLALGEFTFDRAHELMQEKKVSALSRDRQTDLYNNLSENII